MASDLDHAARPSLPGQRNRACGEGPVSQSKAMEAKRRKKGKAKKGRIYCRKFAKNQQML